MGETKHRMAELGDIIERAACAYAQISGNFHRAYYGFWTNYEHDHRECCSNREHAHGPSNNRVGKVRA